MNLIFIIVMGIYLLINSYIFIRIWQALPDNYLIKTLFSIIFIILSCAFIVIMMGRESLPLSIQEPLFYLGVGWFGAIVYFIMFFLLADIVSLSDSLFHFLPSSIARGSAAFYQVRLVLSLIVVSSILTVGYIRFNNPGVYELDLSVHKKAGERKTLRIAAVSDLHLGLIVGPNRLARYVELINASKPDIILIAGDLIDQSVRPLNEARLDLILNKLEAPLGIYMSLGNHEYISGIDASLDFISKTNIKVLRDETICINNEFVLVGRDDKMNHQRKSLSEIIDKKIDKQDRQLPIILIDHQPFNLDDAMHNNIDLQFSGHTHHGQLWPANYITDKIYELSNGYKLKENTHIYVSQGLALWGPPFRVGTRSEMGLITLHFDN